MNGVVTTVVVTTVLQLVILVLNIIFTSTHTKAIKWKTCCILVSGACGCAAPSAERFMLIAESGRVHLHGVVTRDEKILKLERY